jgi:SNF2 family DNA or RNA helicase
MQGYSPFGGLNIVGVMPNTKAEFEQILDPRMRSMPKELVLPFLPPRIRPEPRYVPMSPKQKKAYKQMEEDMLTRLDDGTVIFATNSLTKNTRLLQFSSASAVINEEGEVRLSEPSSKLDELDNIIDEMNGEPLVVVAESLQLINLAQARMDKRGITYRMVTGDIPAGPIREQNIEDFQEGKAQVMLMTIKAGGVGITLTRAGVIVFLQRSWSMIDNKQCEDRVHRIGSEIHDKIVIIDMIAADTVEESQIPRLHEKLNRLQEIVRHRETLLANGNVEAVAALDAEKERIEASPLWGTDVMREGVNDE